MEYFERDGEMAIVKDFHIGGTRIKIADDYCRKSKEETDRILGNVAQILVKNLCREGENNGKKLQEQKETA